jgi:hypothetical protein
MKKQLIIVTAFFALAFFVGFAYPAWAVEKNSQVTICILFDNGVNTTLDAGQAKSQASLSDWMANNLVKVFASYTQAGYQAKLIEKREDFTYQPNNYLLTVKIIKYRPGSKAARMVVGFGAGGVSLKIHYELLADSTKAILTQDDQVYSGREWMYAARKLNQNMAGTVIKKLGDK